MAEFQKPDYTYRVVRISKEVSKEHESPRVIDGDTVDVLIDLGFYSTIRKRVRLLDIDTDELRGGTEATKERAKAAKLRIEDLLSIGQIYVQTEMDAEGKYGRLLGRLFVEIDYPMTEHSSEMIGGQTTIINVNQTLIDEGFMKGEESNTDVVRSWIKRLLGK